jgi:menaquinone-dependent protoporphyrinogen oxidase
MAHADVNESDRRQSPVPDDGCALIAYASRYGSTRGVAERIAAKLGERGNRVELRPVSEVNGVSAYSAVVFGSAVFNQIWTPEAEAFVHRNESALASRPVWMFSVGTFGDRKRLIGRLMTREPRGIATILERIHPRDYRVFAGLIDRHQWPFASRLFHHALGGRLGDNRDWPEIDAWAEGIAESLRERRGENYGPEFSGECGGQVPIRQLD